MYRVTIRVPNPASLGLVQEGHIVAWRSFTVYILQANVHGSHNDTKFLETGEEIEEMVWGQRELRWLDGSRAECEEGQ